MTLDQTANFVRVGVSGSHDDIATTVTLAQGDASVLPDPSNGKYNLVWFDAGTFARPDEDPNVEIVRAQSIDTQNDTLLVSRGEESTSASTKNTVGGEYVLVLAPTSKMFDDIAAGLYTDTDAVNAINNETSLDVSITGDADTLDGVQLANITWSDINIDQSDVNYSDLGNADAAINLNGNDIVDGVDTVWDATASNIPQSRLENDSLSVAGKTVSLGGSTSIAHSDISSVNPDDHHTKYTDAEAVSAVNNETTLNVDISGDAATVGGQSVNDFFTSSGGTLTGALQVEDDVDFAFGTDNDFIMEYDSVNDELLISDSNNNELLRLQKGAPAKFIQGAEVGPLEGQSNTVTSIADVAVTSNASVNTEVGYSFDIDSQSVLRVKSLSDGLGDTNNSHIEIDGDIEASGTLTENASL